MDFPILGQVRPNFKAGKKIDKADKYGTVKYGWRKSTHKGWFQCRPQDVGGANDWATEAEIFIGQLGEHSSRNQVKICAVSADGKVQKKALFDPSKDWDNALKLMKLEPEKNNIMFDPVLWRNGKRSKKTKLGFGTISGVHPFEFFPEPVMFWTIGPNAYQFLSPWHEEISLKEDRKRMRDQSVEMDSHHFIPKQNLMHLPGSLIHRPNMPPVTAAVLYDAYACLEPLDSETLWTKY